jgi:hypothetical protein
MRALKAALLATLLLACENGAGEPAQPTEGSTPAAILGNTEAADAQLATTEGTALVRGYFATGFPNGGSSEPLGTSFTRTQKLALPAGKYIANGSAVLATNEARLRYVDCIFLVNGRIVGDAARGMIGGTGRDNFMSLPLTAGINITAPTNLVLGCRSDVAGVVFTQTSHITAIRVDRLTIQQP